MKIFVAHSSSYDFKNELYLPLRKSALNTNNEIVLPRENGYEVVTRDIIKNSDVVIAEVSYPSTGQGIELGWADIFEIPIICIYKDGNTYSNSLKKLTSNFISYTSTQDMIEKLTDTVEKLV